MKLGNPLLDLDISVDAGVYLWSHGAISDETLLLKKTVCNDSTYVRESVHEQLSKGCNDVDNRAKKEMTDIDNSDLLLPQCLYSNTAEQLKILGKRINLHSKVYTTTFQEFLFLLNFDEIF